MHTVRIYICMYKQTLSIPAVSAVTEHREEIHENKMMYIVGGAAGGLLIVMLILVIVLTCHHKQKNKKLKRELTKKRYKRRIFMILRFYVKSDLSLKGKHT